jgi:ADP-ribose pyrophosphatase YjhB (NUDIX family)
MDLVNRKNPFKILVTVNCVIFGFDGKQLKVLMIRSRNETKKRQWHLIGDFLGKDEDADSAATRVLNDLIGKDAYIEQLNTASTVKNGARRRTISITYVALINIEDYEEDGGGEYEARWFTVSEVPEVNVDCKTILLAAIERLRFKVAHDPLGFALLPEKFTLPQLRSFFEAIYEVPLDRRNFIKKMHSMGVLQKLNEKDKQSSRKGAFYYVFDDQKYREVQSSRLRFV